LMDCSTNPAFPEYNLDYAPSSFGGFLPRVGRKVQRNLTR
jgi:hypothetical protein